MFAKLYDRVISWSSHRHAPVYLGSLSAAESSFFPIPPDVMLAPMCLARPDRAWWFATLCTVSSVLGGLLGYLIGRLAFSGLEPWLMSSHYAPAFEMAMTSFDQYGFWFILVAGFTPIPYKVFTISAGVVGMPVIPFTLGSLAGRGGRFFLVAGLIRMGGEKFASRLRKHVDLIGWVVLSLAIIAGLIFWLGSDPA